MQSDELFPNSAHLISRIERQVQKMEREYGKAMGKMNKIRRMALVLAALLILLMTAAVVWAEEGHKNRYEMEIVLNEEDMDRPRVEMTVQITLLNDSEDIWTEVCFRDFMSTLYKWYAWDIGEAGYESGVVRAMREEKELTVRTEEVCIPLEEITDESAVYVELDAPLAPGESVTLTLEYAADLFEGQARCAYNALIWDGEDGSARTYELAQFYPMLAVYEDGEWDESAYFTDGECFYSRCADYDIMLRVPERYEVIASGEETKGETVDGMTEWVITAENMRDVSIVISNEYAMKTGEAYGVMVNSWYAPNQASEPGNDHEEQGDIQLQAALDSIAAFTDAYGSYPYGELDVVESNYGYGGMEAPGLIRVSQMYSWFMGEDDSAEDQAEYTGKCAGTVAHETAHEWFYGVVGNDQYGEAWLDESFAAFSEQVYWRHVGRSEEEVAAAMAPFVEQKPKSGDCTVDRAYDELNSEQYFDYTDAVYQRGAGFLYQLEQSMGQECFYDFMREYYAAYAFKEADTQGFLAVIAPYIEENEEAQEIVRKYLNAAEDLF